MNIFINEHIPGSHLLTHRLLFFQALLLNSPLPCQLFLLCSFSRFGGSLSCRLILNLNRLNPLTTFLAHEAIHSNPGITANKIKLTHNFFRIFSSFIISLPYL
jgi:hypothetical protein